MIWPLRYRFICTGLLFALTSLAQPTHRLTGRVMAYDVNHIGDYDGLRLRTATGEVQLHFPPHTAAAIRKLAGTGQTVVVESDPRPAPLNPSGIASYRLVRLQNVKTGQTLPIADVPPPAPQSGKLVDVEEPLIGLRHDAEGRLIALLTTTYLVELKPHQSEPVGALLKGVRQVRVVGYERTAAGFVNQTGRRLLHPTTLTVHGQMFAL